MGRIHTTHASAVRHGFAEVPDEAVRVGALRRPPAGFTDLVERNYPALAPPAAVLEALADRVEAFAMRGLCESGAHNAAWEELDVTERYERHLSESPAARSALDDVVARVESSDRPVVVVAGETAEKRSHAPALRAALESRLD